MEDLTINRLRTLSSMRWEDPYFTPAFTKKTSTDFFDEKEEEYMKNGLESCIYTKPVVPMNFEYLNN
jgi:hypothetical protein